MDSLDDFECYDELLYEPLHRLGWNVEPISWHRTDIDWNHFNAVLIRSTWDYQSDPQKFINVLETIDHASARLENNINLVKWNISKTYLRDLEERGVNVVPTIWRQGLSAEKVDHFFDELDAAEIVIKPIVSANANDTFRLSRGEVNRFIPELETAFKEQDYMIQPFMRGIVEEGEFSLFFFGEDYSHTILKTPKPKDFRVQEEHGGRLHSAEPDPSLVARARETLETVKPKPLYARADFVRVSGSFALMELELIEPSLYFNMDSTSPGRFARAFDKWMGGES